MTKKLIAASCVIGVLAVGGIAFWNAWKVTPVNDSFVVELGESVSADPGDYFTGSEWSVEKAEIDLSEVEQDKPGSYSVYGHHGFTTYTYTVTIQDTTPPVITNKAGDIYLQVRKSYTPYDLIDNVTDLSGDVELNIEAEGRVRKTLIYEETGIYTVTVKATDPSGNTAESHVSFLMDTAPEITGMPTAYVAPGNEISLEELAQGVAAYDEVDGELTERILIDTSEVDWNTEGEYKVVYSATDCYGLEGMSYGDVYVLSADRLQEAINTHQINRLDQIIKGAYNLYDAGYYEEDDPKFIVKTMEPAFVRVMRTDSYGSGFIINITDYSVIVCTNRHVVKKSKTVGIVFHNGMRIEGNVIAAESKLDAALIEVPLDDIPQELLDTLMTVHIDRGYWDSLENGEPISLCVRTIKEDGSVWRDTIGTMALKLGQLPEYMIGYIGIQLNEMTELNMNLYNGSSGSAILDGHGNLISVVDVYAYDENRKKREWGIPLPDILDFYEQVMGRPANYR